MPKSQNPLCGGSSNALAIGNGEPALSMPMLERSTACSTSLWLGWEMSRSIGSGGSMTIGADPTVRHRALVRLLDALTHYCDRSQEGSGQ